MSSPQPLLNAWLDTSYKGELVSKVIRNWSYGMPMHPQAGPEVVAAVVAGSDWKTKSILKEMARVVEREDTQLVLAKMGRIYLWHNLLRNPSLQAGTFSYLIKRLQKYAEGPRQRILPKGSEVNVLKSSLRTGVGIEWMDRNALNQCLSQAERDEDFAQLTISAPQSACAPFRVYLERHEYNSMDQVPDSPRLLLGVQSMDPAEAYEWLETYWPHPRARLIMKAREAGCGELSLTELWREIRAYLRSPREEGRPRYTGIDVLPFLTLMLSRNGLAEVDDWDSGAALWHEGLRKAMAVTLEETLAEGEPVPVLEAHIYTINKITLEPLQVTPKSVRAWPITALARASWISDEELMTVISPRGRYLTDFDVERLIEHRSWTVGKLFDFISPAGMVNLAPEVAVSSQVLVDALTTTKDSKRRVAVGNFADHLEWLNNHGGTAEVQGEALEKLVEEATLDVLHLCDDHHETRQISSRMIEEVCGNSPAAWDMLFSLGSTWEASLGDLLMAVRAVAGEEG